MTENRVNLQKFNTLRDENARLRAALAMSKDPCLYCQLPADEMAKCKAGFPGCARADDTAGCPEFGSAMALAMLEEEHNTLHSRIEGLREALGVIAMASGMNMPDPEETLKAIHRDARMALRRDRSNDGEAP